MGYRFTQLSMNAGSIPKIKRLVREVRGEDCEALLRDALECTTARDVEVLVKAFLAAKVSFASSMFGGVHA